MRRGRKVITASADMAAKLTSNGLLRPIHDRLVPAPDSIWQDGNVPSAATKTAAIRTGGGEGFNR
jgi:hypothetical protein